ncbi:hypothetical protein C1H46_007683 [Malus baccata]|uniref:Uncharacterized protein n=1 Tax=Malus baccata TaxID=106549 RepID=A0A540N6Q4_MALBA|nr:hypothetical protein C1H46_007683 [Malus baccata]
MASAIRERDSTTCTTTATSASFNHNVNGECDKSGCRRPFGKKCSHLVKKQRTKFYIFRRCIAMLLCWHERGDS